MSTATIDTATPPPPFTPPPLPPRPRLLPPKLLQIGLLLLITLVAGWPVSSLIEEREGRQSKLMYEFQQSWGPAQVVHAPLLVVPVEGGDGKRRRYLKIAPAAVESAAELRPEQRKRGLFAATVYEAHLTLSGSFEMPSAGRIAAALEDGGTLRWQDAAIMLETRGLSGLRADDGMTWGGQPLQWRNCRDVIRRDDECSNSVIIAQPHLTAAPAAGTVLPFTASLTLRGTGGFQQVLEGRRTVATITAPWATPSFTGGLLPASSQVGEDDFRAQWQSIETANPQLWLAGTLPETITRGQSVGVDLLEAVPTYRMIHRVSKYNLLFVALAFTTYYLFELLSGLRIHMAQYGLLGVSLSLFALLLVSFAEPLGYGAGYGIAAGMVLAQAALYTASVTRRLLPSLIFAAMLAGLFGFLYVLLSLETYSLMLGSVGLFLVVSLVMALTRRVDWAGTQQAG